jgi:hypothetical protein
MSGLLDVLTQRVCREQILGQLACGGIAPADIGVICFFRAQARPRCLTSSCIPCAQSLSRTTQHAVIIITSIRVLCLLSILARLAAPTPAPQVRASEC